MGSNTMKMKLNFRRNRVVSNLTDKSESRDFFDALKSAGQRGMTLIEIIIVVALLGTLMTYLIRQVQSMDEGAREDQARLAMGTIFQSLQAFKAHNSRYPTTDQGLEALIDNPGESKRWRGPYIDENKLVDPWQQSFEYESDGRSVKITSLGIDGQLGTEDDISYPEARE